VALTKFNVKIFDTPMDLYTFVTTDTNLASVVSIVSDASGKYVLFYLVS